MRRSRVEDCQSPRVRTPAEEPPKALMFAAVKLRSRHLPPAPDSTMKEKKANCCFRVTQCLVNRCLVNLLPRPANPWLCPANLRLRPANLRLRPANLCLCPANLCLCPANLRLRPANLCLCPANPCRCLANPCRCLANLLLNHPGQCLVLMVRRLAPMRRLQCLDRFLVEDLAPLDPLKVGLALLWCLRVLLRPPVQSFPRRLALSEPWQNPHHRRNPGLPKLPLRLPVCRRRRRCWWPFGG